ncbi:hypothetical protein Tco_0272371 [Tanacetum coccineum]
MVVLMVCYFIRIMDTTSSLGRIFLVENMDHQVKKLRGIQSGARSITKKAAVAALGMRYAGAYGQVVFSKTISYGSLYSYALHKYPQKLCYKDQETALKFHVCLNDKKMVFEGDPSEIRRLCLVEYREQIIEQTLKHVRVRKVASSREVQLYRCTIKFTSMSIKLLEKDDCCGHIKMWVEEASKSEGRAVGHVTSTELVADWAFDLIKVEKLAFLLSKSKSRSNRSGPAPERRMK